MQNYIKNSQIRALADSGNQRVALFPNVPLPMSRKEFKK
jgi:hypothetical protein